MDLIKLQNMIHKQSVSCGWWDEERPFSTFVCLFHSELSEAMEGDRKGLMDDHLTQYPMFQVELADFVIRCLDYLGSTGNGIKFSNDGNVKLESNCEYLALMHKSISDAFITPFHSSGCRNVFIVEAVDMAIHCAKMEGFDLHKIILEKVEYNKHREDHKRENREKEGGKKY